MGDATLHAMPVDHPCISVRAEEVHLLLPPMSRYVLHPEILARSRLLTDICENTEASSVVVVPVPQAGLLEWLQSVHPDAKPTEFSSLQPALPTVSDSKQYQLSSAPVHALPMQDQQPHPQPRPQATGPQRACSASIHFVCAKRRAGGHSSASGRQRMTKVHRPDESCAETMRFCDLLKVRPCLRQLQ